MEKGICFVNHRLYDFKERLFRNLLNQAGISLSSWDLKEESGISSFQILNSENGIILSSRSIKFSKNLRFEKRRANRMIQVPRRLAMQDKAVRFRTNRLKNGLTGETQNMKLHPLGGMAKAPLMRGQQQPTSTHGGSGAQQNKMMDILRSFGPNCHSCPTATAVRASCPDGTARSPSRFGFAQAVASALMPTSPCGTVVCNAGAKTEDRAQNQRGKIMQMNLTLKTRTAILILLIVSLLLPFSAFAQIANSGDVSFDDTDSKPLSPLQSIQLDKSILVNKTTALIGNTFFYSGIGLTILGITQISRTDVDQHEVQSYEKSNSDITTAAIIVLTGQLLYFAGPTIACISGTNVSNTMHGLKVSSNLPYKAWEPYKQAWLFSLLTTGVIFASSLTNSETPLVLCSIGAIGFSVMSIYSFGRASYDAYNYINNVDRLKKADDFQISLQPSLDNKGRFFSRLVFTF